MQYDFLLKSVGQIKEWTQNVKLKFLRLACELDSEKVPSILLFDRFPLDEALEICKTWQNVQGVAVIQLKFGQYKEVCNTYLQVVYYHKILRETIQKSLTEVNSNYVPSIVFTFDTFFNEVKQLLEIDREGITDPLIEFWCRSFDAYAELLEEVNKRGFLYKRFWSMGKIT